MSTNLERQCLSLLLIVEGEGARLRALTAVMQHEGFDVVGCTTAADALEHVRRDDVGVAVVNLCLPDLSGIQLVEKIRALNARLRVIIDAAYGSSDSAREAVDLGVLAGVEQARDPEELVRHVHRAFRAHCEHNTADLPAAVGQRVRALCEAVQLLRREIAARKGTEEAVRESEERFRRTFDQWPIGAAMVSLDYHFLRVNEALCRITGYSQAELTALAFADIIHPDDLAAEVEQARRLLAGKTNAYTLDERYLRKDGTVVWVRVWMSLMEEAGGEGLCFLPMIEDITERKRSEERARQLLHELAHVSRVHIVGEMAAAIAHELNQPLSAIMSYADVCQRVIRAHTKNADELIPDLKQISAAAQQGAEIIRRLRNMASKRPARRSTLNLNEVVQEAVSLVKDDALTHHVRLRLELAPELPSVLADSVLIQQVLVNLARNAIEAMNATKAGARDLIIQTSAAGHDAVAVAVCDTGPGLPAEVKNRLFEPFVTTKPEGMGLGLSVSQAIIKSNGGQLLASANPERGMTFRFTLPTAQGESDNGT